MYLQLFAHGAAAHLGIAPEAVWGTPVAATTYIPLISESWQAEVEQVKDEGLRGTFADGEEYQGVWTAGGDITFDVRPISFGHILRGVLGPPATAGVADPYTHTYTPRATNFHADCPLNPYTLELFRDLGQSQQYAGGAFNSLRLEFGAAQKLLRATLNGMSKGKPVNIAKTVPSLESAEPLKWRQAVVKLGDTIAGATTLAYLESFGMTINNGLEGVETSGAAANDSIGQIARANRRVIDFQTTFALPDLVEYNKFLAGTARAWDITFTVSANISLQIKLPLCRYQAFPIPVGGPGRLSVQVTGKAKYSATDTFDVQMILKNATASYA